MAEIGTNILKAKHFLDRGEVIAIPTETVYGLAANALNETAVAKIFDIKNRPATNPLIIHIGRKEQIASLTSEQPRQFDVLCQTFWPGPLTLLYPKSRKVSDLVTASLDRVAIRMPGQIMSLQLLTQLDYPLVAPSANPFTYISPTKSSHVQQQLGRRIPYILDGGRCRIGLESTIIGLEQDELTIYRLGAIPKEEIEKVIGKSVNVYSPSAASVIHSPGQQSVHYAPRTQTILSTDPIRSLHSLTKQIRVGLITISTEIQHPLIHERIILSPTHDITEAASSLYEAMHDLDHIAIDVILIEAFPNHSLGRSINDRLRRAAQSIHTFEEE